MKEVLQTDKKNMTEPTIQLIHGDCVGNMGALDEATIDTIITDPPYGIGFFGLKWDREIPGEESFRAMYRVAKPGATLLCFGGSRTFHRLGCRIEDAGWMLRDVLMWVYASGLPKSDDMSRLMRRNGRSCEGWEGYRTTLKPAYEPILVAMKPHDGSGIDNAEKWGVCGFWVDGGRIPGVPWRSKVASGSKKPAGIFGWAKSRSKESHPGGRFPTNLIIDESAMLELEEQYVKARRMIFCPKADRRDRGEWNDHPTVKPAGLMDYLVKLTRTPSGGVVLDPYMGSGSTALACLRVGRDFIGIERDPRYFGIAEKRLAALRSEIHGEAMEEIQIRIKEEPEDFFQ